MKDVIRSREEYQGIATAARGRFRIVGGSLVIAILAFVCYGILSTTAARALQPLLPEQAVFPPMHFHHVHLNSTDPAAAIDFYTTKFDCEKGKFAGLLDGVWAQKSWLLFNKVSAPPPWEPVSGIWHMGWGAEDMEATYKKQLDSGTKFFTPLSDISDLAGGAANSRRFFYAYVDGPDHALIELNTAGHHRFGHVHMFSEDPVTTGLWYMKYFGARRMGNATQPPSREPRMYHGFQVGPAMSLLSDNVNIIVYPVQLSKQSYPDYWKGRTGIAPTRGRAIDHIGFSCDNLAETLELMRKDGVKVTDEVKSVAGGKIKYAFIEGPDQVRIELVEGQAHKD